MHIIKPIFILGSGRSGTTLLYNLLAGHPEVCWFSNITNRFFTLPTLSILHNTLYSLSNLHVTQRPMTFIVPSEGENIYSFCGFRDDRKMATKEITDILSTKFTTIVSMHLAATQRPRFLNKRTANTQRIDCINTLFPDAYFIHIIRDGRAVAHSLIKTDWWNNIPLWWKGKKTPHQLQESGVNPIEIAALHWKHNVEEIISKKGKLKHRYLEIRYEDLVQNPRLCIQAIIEFTHLSSSDKFLTNIPRTFPNLNNKWQIQLTNKQKQILSQTIDTLEKKLGYV